MLTPGRTERAQWRARQQIVAWFARARPLVAYGYEAMASALGAIDRADDPLSRSSVVEAYFDGTERDSVLGTYSITEEGETTLDAPLAAYRVEDGEVLPAR